MEFGIFYFPTDETMAPGPLARLIEERGHTFLLVPEHTHIPASRESPSPSGGELPRRYMRTWDPFIALAAAATTTTQLRLGTGICLLIERDPIVTAKEVATLDRLSGGRILFGIGAGWNREEMANHGTDPRKRMRVMQERAEAIREIWTSDEASYQGEFVSFENIWSWPKPVQAPHPPILIGGNGPTVLDRVLAYGDGWIPNFPRGGVLERIAELKDRADRPLRIDVMSVPAKPDVLESLAVAGVDSVTRLIPSASQGPIEAALERWEQAIAEFLGES